MPKPPDVDELEISVFGPGVGECIVIHLGGGDWFIVDSCLHPKSRDPAALLYLSSLGVSSSAIKGIVVSHWHDDHIKGIAKVAAAAPEARVILSSALQRSEFTALLCKLHDLDATGSDIPMLCPEAIGSGVSEIAQILQDRFSEHGKTKYKGGFSFALADRALYAEGDRRLTTLSPCDKMVIAAAQRFAEILPPGNLRRVIPAPHSNSASIVLCLRFSDISAILGADMERAGDPQLGWQAVLTSVECPKAMHFFKVPHHGGVSAYDPAVWALGSEHMLAAITPYFRGQREKQLPKDQDLQRMAGHTEAVYLTAFKADRRKFREGALRKEVDATLLARRPLSAKSLGHVRLRGRNEATLSVECFDGAGAVCL